MSFDFKNDPIENFLKLYKEAQVKGVPEANAMALATVNEHNQPSVRIVFMKGVDERGFCFFTNYEGRKARDIEANNKVSANFFWPHLDRQVRIEGHVQKVTREESEAYFAMRPRLSQIGAWTSHQSDKLASFADFQT
jgi:pyridoxamine 5'-phosphate oxidase